MSKKRKGAARRRHSQQARHAVARATVQDTQVEPQQAAADTPQDVVTEGSPASGVAMQSSDREQRAVELGRKLQRAREEQGLELDQAARQMRLPWRVIQKLEAGDWQGIDSPIYLKSYLQSYSELLGLEPPDLLDELSRRACAPKPLVSTGGISRSRYLVQRYAVAGTYLVITALIVVPVLVLGINGGPGQRMTHVASLDPVPAGSTMAPTAMAGDRVTQGAKSAAGSAEKPGTLMASMAPVGLMDHDANAAPQPVTSATPDTGTSADSGMPTQAGDDTLTISLNAPSWVEVTSASGKRIEYALLEDGKHHYAAGLPLTVRLGNAGAAQVRVHGQALDLSAFQRSNVAYFRIDSHGKLRAPDSSRE